MIALASQRVNDVMASLKNNKAVSALGLIDKDGLIDVKAACDALKQTARKHGKLSLDLPVFDVTFNFTEQNIETLRGYIEQAAGVQERE